MILCLTPNPALDVTYEIPALQRHAEHRVSTVRVLPGGKGINAARVLDSLGRGVIAAGPLGGPSGQRLEDLLAALAPRIHRGFTPIAASTRSTVTLVDPGGATAVNEPGPRLSPQEVEALISEVLEILRGERPAADLGPGTLPRALLISGSLPDGITAEHLGRLIAAAREGGIPSLVDTSGEALLDAARAGASMLLPNRREAIEATGEEEIGAAIGRLLDLGAGTVVCSQGPDGVLAATRAPADRGNEGTTAWLRVRPPALAGNATGAGDAAAASLAASLADSDALPDALVAAVATSAAAVLRPVAGEIDAACRAHLLSTLTLENIPCPSSR